MKRIFTLRSLVVVCLATLCSLLLPMQMVAATTQESPNATKSVVTTNMWLEEGYKWTYTNYLYPHPSFDELPDVTVIYELGALETIEGKEYYPVIMSIIHYNEGSETVNKDIVAYLRQNENGTIFYRPEQNLEPYSIGWLRGSTEQLDDKIRKGLKNGTLDSNEYPIWRGSKADDWVFMDDGNYNTESVSVEVKTLNGIRKGERFLEPNRETWSVWEPKIYLAYVDGLGRVGVYEDGTLAPEFEGNFFGPNIGMFSGFVEIDFYRSLLYSIQRGDGTYLVLNEQNAPNYETGAFKMVGADAAGVTVSTGHNTLTVTAAAPAEVTVIDLAGRVVAKARVNGEQQFSLGAGIYLLTIDGHTRKITVK